MCGQSHDPGIIYFWYSQTNLKDLFSLVSRAPGRVARSHMSEIFYCLINILDHVTVF